MFGFGPKQAIGGRRDLRYLGECLSGHYLLAAQTASDTNYLNVRLHVVPLWPEERR